MRATYPFLLALIIMIILLMIQRRVAGSYELPDCAVIPPSPLTSSDVLHHVLKNQDSEYFSGSHTKYRAQVFYIF
jgi:hypothetical protein